MPSRSEIERRIFVVGVPRSGTTLVQSLLAAHSAVTSFTESHFFDKQFARLPGLPVALLVRDPRWRVRHFVEVNDGEGLAAAEWFERGRGRWSRSGPLLPLWTFRVARQFIRLLDELAERRGAANWVEKTPRHLRYVPFLERLSSSNRFHFVHVIRGGLEVVASLHRASQTWERPYDPETCARRWNADVAFSASRIGSVRDHFVVYEELVDRPELVLQKLLAELDLEWEPGILREYGAAAELLTTSEESWKAGVGRRIEASATSKENLTADERQRVARLLAPALYRRFCASEDRSP